VYQELDYNKKGQNTNAQAPGFCHHPDPPGGANFTHKHSAYVTKILEMLPHLIPVWNSIPTFPTGWPPVPDPGTVLISRSTTNPFFCRIDFHISMENPYRQISVTETIFCSIFRAMSTIHIIDTWLPDLETTIGLLSKMFISMSMVIPSRLNRDQGLN
jgi:hypothetical protein